MLQNFYYVFNIVTTCLIWVSAVGVGIARYNKVQQRKEEAKRLEEEFSKEAEEDSEWKYRYFDVDFDNTNNMSLEINERCSNGSELVQIIYTNKGFKGIFRVLEEVKK